MYCTVDEARAAGAAGTDEQVTAAIAAAQQRVDRYTGELWETTPELTVRARVRGDGLALLPRRVQTVDAVRYAGAEATLAPSAYRVRSSAVLGDLDALEWISTLGYWNDLVVGAERWNGGWANLSRDGELYVTGTFGHVTTPAAISQATALLAASISTDGGVRPQVVDDEGQLLRLGDEDLAPAGQGTGVTDADDLLKPYRRYAVRVG